MLVLSRKPGQRIRIAGDIQFTVLEINDRSVRIGVEAPSRIPIARGELLKRPKVPKVRTNPTDGRHAVKISIKGKVPELNKELESDCVRRIQIALGRFGGVIRRVRAYLTPGNAPFDRPTYRCQLVVEFVPSGQVCIEDVDAELCTAANRVINRIGRVVSQELERRRTRPYQSARGFVDTAAGSLQGGDMERASGLGGK